MKLTLLHKIKYYIKRRPPIFYIVIFQLLNVFFSAGMATYYQYTKNVFSQITYCCTTVCNVFILVMFFLLWSLKKQNDKLRKQIDYDQESQRQLLSIILSKLEEKK